VHSQLAQHGSEKLLYELAKLMIKQGLTVDVLVRPFFVRNQYYYPLLRKIGVSVIQRLLTFRHITFIFKSFRSSKSILAVLLRSLYSIYAEIAYFSKARTYDRIVIIGMETYCDTFRFMRGDKSFIYVHHVMHRFQQDRDYTQEYDLRHIIVCDERQNMEISESLPEIKRLMFPLPIDLKELSNKRISTDYQYAFKQGNLIRIGVVSRIKLDRPNEPIIRHFAALSKIMPVELNFFGSGDPAIYSDLLSELSLVPDKVRFHGHTDCISSSFEAVGIDIGWSVTMMGSISYAAIELIALGIPVFFINIGDKISEKNNQAVDYSESEVETIAFHHRLFRDSEQINLLMTLQHAHVHKMYDAELIGIKLKKFYDLE
jgi:hypothetical protein